MGLFGGRKDGNSASKRGPKPQKPKHPKGGSKIGTSPPPQDDDKKDDQKDGG